MIVMVVMMMMMMMIVMMMTITIWSSCWSLDNGGFFSSCNKRTQPNFNLSNLKKVETKTHQLESFLPPQTTFTGSHRLDFLGPWCNFAWKNNQRFRRVYTNPYHPLIRVYLITLAMIRVDEMMPLKKVGIRLHTSSSQCHAMDGMTYMTFINPWRWPLGSNWTNELTTKLASFIKVCSPHPESSLIASDIDVVGVFWTYRSEN